MIDSQISCNFMKQLKLSSLIVSFNNIALVYCSIVQSYLIDKVVRKEGPVYLVFNSGGCRCYLVPSPGGCSSSINITVKNSVCSVEPPPPQSSQLQVQTKTFQPFSSPAYTYLVSQIFFSQKTSLRPFKGIGVPL